MIYRYCYVLRYLLQLTILPWLWIGTISSTVENLVTAILLVLKDDGSLKDTVRRIDFVRSVERYDGRVLGVLSCKEGVFPLVAVGVDHCSLGDKKIVIAVITGTVKSS